MTIRLNEDELREIIAEHLQRRGLVCGDGDVMLIADTGDNPDEQDVAAIITAEVEVQIPENPDRAAKLG